MTIAAGSFFFFGVEKLFLFLIIFMMATPAIILLRLRMPRVQGSIKPHGLPEGRKARFFPVAVVAFHRAGFCAGDSHLAVAGDACLVIEVHGRQFIAILKTLEFR